MTAYSNLRKIPRANRKVDLDVYDRLYKDFKTIVGNNTDFSISYLLKQLYEAEKAQHQDVFDE